MKIVCICAPFDESTEQNMLMAKHYLRYALNLNVVPLIPYWYEDALKAVTQKEIQKRENIPTNLLYFCNELWVFGNRLTSAMKNMIQSCETSGKTVVWISDKRLTTTLKRLEMMPYVKDKK